MSLYEDKPQVFVSRRHSPLAETDVRTICSTRNTERSSITLRNESRPVWSGDREVREEKKFSSTFRSEYLTPRPVQSRFKHYVDRRAKLFSTDLLSSVLENEAEFISSCPTAAHLQSDNLL